METSNSESRNIKKLYSVKVWLRNIYSNIFLRDSVPLVVFLFFLVEQTEKSGHKKKINSRSVQISVNTFTVSWLAEELKRPKKRYIMATYFHKKTTATLNCDSSWLRQSCNNKVGNGGWCLLLLGEYGFPSGTEHSVLVYVLMDAV